MGAQQSKVPVGDTIVETQAKMVLAEQPSRELESVERARSLSRSLSDAARRVRFSRRSRDAFSGRSTARQQAANQILRRSLFVLIVLMPNLFAITYFGFIASNQYESVAKFVIFSGELPKMDDIGSMTGLPPVAILQNTMILVSYVESQELVTKLQERVNLRSIYSKTGIDLLSRFDVNEPIEKLVSYWNNRSSVAISSPSAIITLRVRAFTPEDAKRVADAVVAESEAMINRLNDRMYTDTVSASEKELNIAGEALKRTRINYERARNGSGIIDVKTTTSALYSLLTDLQGQRLKTRAQLGYLSPQSPQLRLIKEREAALTQQIAEVQAKITETNGDVGDEALSERLGKFAELDLEQKISEKRYSETAANLNMARLISERKMLYLHQIVGPGLAEQARYPYRLVTITLVLVGSLLLWVSIIGILGYLRQWITARA